MIYLVTISARVRKEVEKIPEHIRANLRYWIASVEQLGLSSVRKVPGYHDEPLQGRRKGQRSIRLSKYYRAIYRVCDEGGIEFVSIEEVTKHGY